MTETHYNKVMILDDDIFFGTLLKHFVKNQGYEEVEFHQNENSFINSISQDKTTIFILDYHLKNGTGVELIPNILTKTENSKILFISAEKKTAIANRTKKKGAIDFILKNKSIFKKLDEILKEIH